MESRNCFVFITKLQTLFTYFPLKSFCVSGSIAEFHLTFSCHVSVVFQSVTFPHSFLVFHDLNNTFDEYLSFILLNFPQFEFV